MNLVEWLSTAVAMCVVASAMLGGAFIGRYLERGRRTRSSDPTLGDFFEQTSDAALVTENGTVVQANSAAARFFGYSPGTLIGLRVQRLLAEAGDEARFVRALRNGPLTDYPLSLRTANGRILECIITATARFDEHGRVIGCSGIARDVTERNRIIEELRRAENDYRRLFDHAYDALLVLDPVHEIVLDANQRACAMYGIARHAFIGRSMVELSANPSRGKALLRQTREMGGRYAAFESQQLRSDGTVMIVEINAAEIDYKGRRVILSINRDVTERRKAETAIRESEERFRLLLENVTEYAIVMLDPIGRVVSWNEGAQRVTGYAADEVIGRSAAMFLPPESEGKLVEDLARAADQGRLQVETTRMRKDGTRFSASVTLEKIVDEKGSTHGYAEVTHDITSQVQLATAREEMVEVLRNVASEWCRTFDAVQVPIVLLDREGFIRRVNEAARDLAGEPFRKIVTMRATDLGREPWTTIGALGCGTFARSSACSARVVEGDRVWQVSCCMAGGETGTERVIAVAYDLTLVNQLEASVRRNEVAAALGSLVAGVAHEVRNPLFTISATLDAWEARFSTDAGMSTYAGLLREQTDRLNRLMRDLLEYGKPNPLAVAEGRITQVIRSAASACGRIAAEHSAGIALDLADLPPQAIDSARLEQVFQNVIDNALRLSPAGSTVRVTAAMDGEDVVCRVIDEGSGIGTQDPETLFQPFFTRRRGGTGLGLSIAQKIVVAHGGGISIANRTDRPGTEVVIRLPFRRVEPRRAAEAYA